MLQIRHIQVLAPCESKDATWSANYDCRRLLLQLLDVSGHRLSTKHDLDADLVFVHVLGESIVLFLDLKS